MTDTSPRGEERRERGRAAASRAAAAGPTAARWLVPVAVARAAGVRGRDGTDALPLDVVGALLALDPRTHLRGRGGDALRAIAGAAEALVTTGATTVGGTPLVDVLVADEAEREALAPSWDLDALLGGDVGRPSPVDRTIRLAQAMTSRAAQHRAGEVDLVDLVAPPGVGRHALADEVEALVAVATDRWPLPVVADPAVAVHADGWVAASPFELFLTAASGVVEGAAADLVGSLLGSWFGGFGAGDAWEHVLRERVDVDVRGLLQQAAARAGSEHPDVLGAALVDLVALRHPLR